MSDNSKERNSYPNCSHSGDEVVISGIAGKFPASDDVVQFMDNLYKKVDMVCKSADGTGCCLINGRNKFDAPFFRVTYKQAEVLDAACRMLLEQAYGAVYDAGINPVTLKGGKIGVFIGSSYDNSCKLYEVEKKNIYAITGNGTKAMYANRISYWIDSKGPSCNIDSGESSSLVALDKAFWSLKRGECDSAIVGGANLYIHPNLTKNMERAGLCSDSNKSTTRSEAINVIFLQKLKDAKRVYAEICHSQVCYNLKSDLIFSPIRSTANIETFLREFYSNTNITCDDVHYVETHGAGDVDPNSEEMQAVLKVFSKNKPVEVGNTKQLMGNAQAASGICALTKICLAYQKGKMFTEFRPRQYRQLDKVTNAEGGNETRDVFDSGFAAVNSFSSGGLDAHILLKCYQNKRCVEDSDPHIPRLLFASGRNDKCVNTLFGIVKNEPLDAERIALLHNIHNTDIPGHTYRGYTVLEADSRGSNTTLSQGVEQFSGTPRPLWFVYSGMGSQWPQMGRALLHLPIFAAAIHRCRKVLEPKGVDIVNILTNPDRRVFDNILNSFVGIAAIQIGLTDLLYHMGIVPDFIIGHSVGELGCGYADGCLSAEEMILAAYSRGLVSVQMPFIHGAMAAIGLGHDAVQRVCPPEIEVACHNSSESSTISGPADDVKKFVKELKTRGIFAKEVQVSNIAYHSKYIAHAGPALLEKLKDVIPTPKPRTKKWICTSLPPQNWDEPNAKYCSAEYHTNNLLNPVYFYEASRLIPPNAVVIEIAPSGLLQPIFRRSHPDCFHVSLTKRWQSNPIKHFLESIGKYCMDEVIARGYRKSYERHLVAVTGIYQVGFNPRVEVLYPKIYFPVSSETLCLSHLVRWVHAENWPNAVLQKRDEVRTSARDLLFSIHDDEFAFIKNFVRNGYHVFPEAAFLYFAWETLAMFKEIPLCELSVCFENLIFHSELKITFEKSMSLNIAIGKGNNGFEISCDNITIASGRINAIPTKSAHEDQIDDTSINTQTDENKILLSSEDVYKILYYRGYKLNNEFQTIQTFDITNKTAIVRHYDNWITLIDSLIQLETLKINYKGVSIPKCITKLTIHTELHKNVTGNNEYYIADVSDLNDTARCAGIELSHIIFENIPLDEPYEEEINELVFIPYDNEKIYDVPTCFGIMLQIVTENTMDSEVRIVNVLDESTFLIQGFKAAADCLIQSGFNFKFLDINQNYDNLEKRIHLVVGEDLLHNQKKISIIAKFLDEQAFILSAESKVDFAILKSYEQIAKLHFNKRTMILLRKKIQKKEQIKSVYINTKDAGIFSWFSQMQSEWNKNNQVVFVHERDTICGLLGFVKKLTKDTRRATRLFIVDDYHAPTFSPKHIYFQEQLQKNMIINILKQTKWGGYYYIPTPKIPVSDNMMLTLTNFGDIQSFKWIESRPALPERKAFVQVAYAGLSFRDSQSASGLSRTDQHTFGIDFSGVNKRQERVMGLTKYGAVASIVEAEEELVWPVPPHWCLEDAATVPMPYVYAYYCLTIKGQLKKGQTVFVNSGAGAVGQAVISICLALDCTVYTTVGSNEKKQFLLKLFPQLKPNNIDDSRNPTFYYSLACSRQPCDFVVNSFTGIFRKAAMKCVASSGIFLNINDVDCTNSDEFGMHFLSLEKSMINVDLSCLFKPQNTHYRKALQFRIAEGIAEGIVRPMSRMVYSTGDVKRAFQVLTSGNHRGRVLIKMKDSTIPKPLMLFNENHTGNEVSVIISDNNDLGIDLADYLVHRGATKIIVHLKSKNISGYARWKQQSLQELGVVSVILNSKLETNDDCLKIIREGIILGAVNGIFIIQNGNSNSESFIDESKFEGKFKETATIVSHLDALSRNYCIELSDFVVITKTTNNYADEYVASVCERICESRKYIGLPALALRTQSVDEFSNDNNTSSALEYLSIRSVFKALDLSLKLKCCIVKVFKKPPPHMMQPRTDKLDSAEDGLDGLYTFIEKDEVMANEPVVQMRTSIGFTSKEHLETDCCLMLIPGLEGNHQVFKSLCESVKINAVTLQMCPDEIANSVADIAMNMRLSMKKFNIRAKSKFYLVGYSFGANVALELAAILENEGLEGVVYCLDSSPDIVKRRLDDYLTNHPDSCVENIILQNIYTVITAKTDQKLNENINNCDSWENKVAVCVSQLKGFGYSMQYIKAVMNSAYNRINIALNYDADVKLKSKLILVKNNSSTEEYNLSQFSTRPVTAVEIDIESDILIDCRVPNIVNRYLDPEVLENFKSINFCKVFTI